MSNSNEPAQPIVDDCISTHNQEIFYGLTKREHFAGLAMQSVLNKYDPWEQGDFDSSDYEIVAKNAIGIADELLKQLESKE